jgi:hypothetical protein
MVAALRLPLLAILCVAVAARQLQQSCPPAGFEAVPNLDISLFFSATWYSQAQQPLSWLPADHMYCVRTTYRIADPSDLKVSPAGRHPPPAGTPRAAAQPHSERGRGAPGLPAAWPAAVG